MHISMFLTTSLLDDDTVGIVFGIDVAGSLLFVYVLSFSAHVQLFK